jgi:hypothetical protein
LGRQHGPADGLYLMHAGRPLHVGADLHDRDRLSVLVVRAGLLPLERFERSVAVSAVHAGRRLRRPDDLHDCRRLPVHVVRGGRLPARRPR